MEHILKDLPGLLIYQDDILIYAENSDTLAKRVSNVTKRLEQKNLTVNLQKSILLTDEIKFLGHKLSSVGIQPDPDILEKILKCKPPTNKHELESFLGLVNFFGRMLPSFSSLVQPLHELRKKDVTFDWGERQQAAFDKLLRSLLHRTGSQSLQLAKRSNLDD